MVVQTILTFLYYLITLYVLGIVVWIVFTSEDFWQRVNGALLYVPLVLRLLRMK